MALTRFKTDRKLWIIISAVLFLTPWFIPLIGKMGEAPPLVYPLAIFTGSDRLFALKATGILVLLFGVAALLIGWVLQCAFVMFKRRNGKNDHAASPET
jgi:hypothetical protein